MTIKSICPKCGGEKQRLRTKITKQQQGWWIGSSHCYKCGYHVPAALTVEKSKKTNWYPKVKAGRKV